MDPGDAPPLGSTLQEVNSTPLTRLNEGYSVLNEGYSVDLEGVAFGMVDTQKNTVRCLVTYEAITDRMRGSARSPAEGVG
jgi:hypothetical protein